MVEEKAQTLSSFKMPSMVRLIDYAYGLAVADLQLQMLADTGFNLTLVMHNASEGPIKYIIKKAQVKMAGCMATGDPPPLKSAIVARGMQSLHTLQPLKKIAVNPTPSSAGTLSIEAEYGHPDGQFVRRVNWELNVTTVIAPPQPRIFVSVTSHTEESLIPQMQ